MPTQYQRKVKKRYLNQWALVPLVFVVIGFGWKYSILGFTVPLVMMIGIVAAFFNGRYVCGNLCPRGAFYDRLLSYVSFKKRIPAFLKNMVFRWVVFILLISFMLYRIFQGPASIVYLGHIFWLMCVVTTVIGLLLGVVIHQRAWCVFCPIGTLASIVGGNKKRLQLDFNHCVSCKKCEKACPLQLPILKDSQNGTLQNRDCLKCLECVAVCPKEALFWKNKSMKEFDNLS